MNRLRPKGFTLLEVIVALGLTAAVLLMSAIAMRSSLMAVDSSAIQTDLECKATAMMDLIARELKDGGTKYPGFSIASSQQSITFARCIGCNNSLPVFGNQITYGVVAYDPNYCLERSETVAGVAQKQLLTDRLSTTSTSVTNAQGVSVNVVGVSFRLVSRSEEHTSELQSRGL